MKLPWVPRSLYTRACSEADTWRVTAADEQRKAFQHAENAARLGGELHRTREHLTAVTATRDAERTEATQRYDTLLARFTELRVAGGAPQPAPLERKEPDMLVMAVMAQTAGMPLGVRARALKQLDRDRKDPRFNEMDVLRMIESGVTPDDGGVPA